MGKQRTVKSPSKTDVRFDNRHVRLRIGERQRENGGYTFRWTSSDGKRHAVYAPTLDELREQEEKVIVDKHDGVKTDVKKKTINEYFDLWCQLKRGIKDSTFKNYIYMYEMFVKPSFGKKRIVSVKKSDVRRYYNDLADQKILKIKTIDNVHNVLHQVFQVAVDDGVIRMNPTDGMLKELKLAHDNDGEKRKALTIEQQKLFFNFLSGHEIYKHWYPVFYIMCNTGMRVGEITGLRWSDIDLNEKTININHTLVYYNHRDENGCYFSINTPKTKAGERTIPMTEGVKEAFIMEKEYQTEAEIQSVGRVDGYDDFIFVNKDGNVQNQGTLNKAIKRIMRDCNCEILEKYGAGSKPVLLPAFSCHHLRHTFATRLCESGINLKVIQDVLGHADIQTTMNIYVDVTNELKQKEIASFSTYLNKEINVTTNI
jgi:integrase